MDENFKELSAEQVSEMESADQLKYFNELNEFKAAQLKKMKAELNENFNKELSKSIGELRDEIAANNREQMKIFEAQGIAIKQLQVPKVEDMKSLRQLISDKFKDIQDGMNKSGKYKFQIDATKIASGRVDKTTIGLSSITSDPIGMFLPGWAEIQTQNNRIAPSLRPFQLTPDDHGVIYWTDMSTRTNNAAARSDGSAAAEQVYAWTGYSETVDNISAMVPVHKEAIKHISILQGEIERLLRDDIAVALDDYCYTGTGTAPQIGGIYTRSTAFDAAAYVAAGGFTPSTSTLKDLIVAMAAQIMKDTKYNVDTVWLNPYDVVALKSYKTTDGVPIPLMVNGMIDNIKVVEANSVTAGTCVVGDSSKATLYSTGMAEIEVGYNLTGDFAKRVVTILGNLEASLLIRNAEVDAFLKSTDISSDTTGIEAPVA